MHFWMTAAVRVKLDTSGQLWGQFQSSHVFGTASRRVAFSCGCFALAHLERRLREVWAGEQMRGALPEEAMQHRVLLRQLLGVADRDVGMSYT